MTFSEKITKLREAKNISVKEMADDIGLARSGLFTYEKGNALPSAEVLKKLALYFNVTTDYLLFDDNEKENIIKSTDKRIAEYLEKVKRMNPEDKEYVFKTIDLIVEKKK